MLTSITPLGERGRGQRWGVTATALTVGHLVGGAALGAPLAGLALGIGALGDTSDSSVAIAIALAATLAVLGDLVGVALPGRRQVDERWLNTYRGWVYGLGFGVQLGLGFVTVVNTLLFVVVVATAPLLGPGPAFGIGVVYGAGRAAMALLNGRIRSIEQLKALHRRLDETDRTIRYVSSGLVVAAGVLAVAA